MSIAPGIYHDLNETTYHADPALSYTGMKHLLKSPAHYRHFMDAPREEKKVFDAGHIIHALVLGTSLNLAEIPAELLSANGAASTKAARDFIALARLDGAIPVKTSEIEPLREIAEAVLAHREARELFEGGLSEVSLFANDPRTDVPLRGRVDKVAEGFGGRPVLVDLKTTPDADPAEFRRAIANFGYYLQATVYRHLWDTLNPDSKALEFLIVAVSKTKPHLVSIHRMDALYEDLGGQHMRVAIDRFKAGTESGEWPGFPPIIYDQTPPVWLLDDEDEEIQVS